MTRYRLHNHDVVTRAEFVCSNRSKTQTLGGLELRFVTSNDVDLLDSTVLSHRCDDAANRPGANHCDAHARGGVDLIGRVDPHGHRLDETCRLGADFIR